MEDDYIHLKMEEKGITQVAYQEILTDLFIGVHKNKL